MILGYNHNVMYKGEVFHVQTEDSGIKNPHIITLLYRGGVILSSKKTSYADILMMDNLESVVEELMKAQHKDLMRRLKSGEFDDRAFSIKAQILENYEIPSPKPEREAVSASGPIPEPVPEPVTEPVPVQEQAPEQPPEARRLDDIFSSPATHQTDSAKSDISLLFVLPAQKAAAPAAAPAEKPEKEVISLDEAILNFFGANEK